ncbi:diacylglycerol/polyprenol kinase family protein [Picosynechococcus sp. PCC 11901]|uniref:diacylglycerol/polyprenol kinase family protein n=1 Tax=Picosynechococcus sp. PCC 11901 TaxID=2579791 RepID=UPI0015E89659|nr:diacylglycerol/polyprenol kinase family protein [Picosynechococcus sp. PCC 11901]
MDVNHLVAEIFSPALRMPLGTVITYLGALLAIAEGLSRKNHLSPELTRKIVHIGSGNVILLAWWFDIPMEIGIAAAFIAGLIALISYFLPILPSVNSVGRQSLGTFFYALSMGVLIWWFWSIQQPVFAVLGILVMAWGDGLAAVVGSQLGKHPYEILGNKKSLEGTATMFGVGFLICGLLFLSFDLMLWQKAAIALVVALCSTLLESIAQFGIDNFLVPVGSAAIAFLLVQALI